MEKVSIVVPVYNMGDRIEICVRSLIKQTYSNIEIILVDDGSRDDSYENCKKIAMQDERIVAYHTENRGSGPARNYGIEHASGKYIYFPDADDYLEPDAIEILVKNANETGCDLIVFGYKNINVNGKQTSIKEYKRAIMSGDEIRNDYYDFYHMSQPYSIQGAPWNKFFCMDVIREYGICYPSLRRHQDEGFIARYMSHARKVLFISDVFYTYYTNDLKREWDKYPLNYIDAIEGLFEERKTNILVWNKNDYKTHKQVHKEYICNFIKALELSFSTKFGFSRKERIVWIKEKIANSNINEAVMNETVGIYHRMAYNCVKTRNIAVLYILMAIKIELQKRL